MRTTIIVDTNTREKLKQFGGKGDTYEQIILKLMKAYESKKMELTGKNVY
jgi:hypothetical protein